MIFFKVLFIALFVAIIGGFAYFAITDIKIHQTDKVETMTADQLQQN